MNKIVSVQNEITELEKLFEEHSKKLSNVASEIKFLRRYIERVYKRRRFKYEGKVYFVVIVPLKAYRSALINGKDGNRTIYIDNSISKVERQRELHIILKNKKFIKWF